MTLALLLIGAGVLVAVHQRGIVRSSATRPYRRPTSRARDAVDSNPIAAVSLAPTRCMRSGRQTPRARAAPGRGRGAPAEDAHGDGTRAVGRRRDRGRNAAVTADDTRPVRIWDLGADASCTFCAAPRRGLRRRSLARWTVRRHRGEDGTVRIWNASSGKQIRVLHERGPVHAAAFSPDGSRVVSGGVDRLARIWRTQRRSVAALDSGQLGLDRGRRHSAATGARCATAGGDGVTRCLRSPRPAGLRRDPEPSFAASVAFGPGDLLATGDDAGVIRVRGRRRRSCAGTPTPCAGLDFDDDGRLLASVSGDRSARLWERTQARRSRP